MDTNVRVLDGGYILLVKESFCRVQTLIDFVFIVCIILYSVMFGMLKVRTYGLCH